MKKISAFYDYLEIFVAAVCAVLLIFALGVRLCRVDGHSMDTTLKDGQLLITSDLFYTPKDGDIVVFHQSDNQNESLNKPLVKRVIATSGEWYKLVYMFDGIGYTMQVYVSADETFDENDRVDENYINPDVYKNFPSSALFKNAVTDENGNKIVTAQVPDGKVFVMGDNRYNSNDSRLGVGYVDEKCIVGKAIFSLNPFGGVN